MFFALGDDTRLRLVRRLRDVGPCTATRLADGAPVTRQAVAKHLRVLLGAGLVENERRGREVLYLLRPERLEDAKAFLDAVSAGWDRRLDRLRALVEE